MSGGQVVDLTPFFLAAMHYDMGEMVNVRMNLVGT